MKKIIIIIYLFIYIMANFLIEKSYKNKYIKSWSYKINKLAWLTYKNKYNNIINILKNTKYIINKKNIIKMMITTITVITMIMII